MNTSPEEFKEDPPWKKNYRILLVLKFQTCCVRVVDILIFHLHHHADGTSLIHSRKKYQHIHFFYMHGVYVVEHNNKTRNQLIIKQKFYIPLNMTITQALTATQNKQTHASHEAFLAPCLSIFFPPFKNVFASSHANRNFHTPENVKLHLNQ